MPDDRDPLLILRTTRDPEVARWCVLELIHAGFTDAVGIARDFGWRVLETPA